MHEFELWYQTEKKSSYSRYVTSSQDRLRNLKSMNLDFFQGNILFTFSGFVDSGLFDIMKLL